MAQRELDRLVNAIEGEDRLDRPGHRLEQGLAFAENLLGITRGRARGFLHGVWLGHPLHPVLTDLPIGSWTTALVLDLTGQKRAARAAVGVGLAGALAAAVTGLHDWQHTGWIEVRRAAVAATAPPGSALVHQQEVRP
ncbi:DUF2231 domain-containing protein [Microbispora bryophytorum]|uniref:DUF2231 domain-containing protein n=1 Tax=Microbispora bryophytorum TaxID=1460882 RepID=UPI0033CABA34